MTTSWEWEESLRSLPEMVFRSITSRSPTEVSGTSVSPTAVYRWLKSGERRPLPPESTWVHRSSSSLTIRMHRFQTFRPWQARSPKDSGQDSTTRLPLPIHGIPTKPTTTTSSPAGQQPRLRSHHRSKATRGELEPPPWSLRPCSSTLRESPTL